MNTPPLYSALQTILVAEKPVKHSSTIIKTVERLKIKGVSMPMHRKRHGLVELRGWLSTGIVILVILIIPYASSFPVARQLKNGFITTEQATRLLVANRHSDLDSGSRTLGLLTFDLDDTLFPTEQVVGDANAKMIVHLQNLGVDTTLADFLDATRSIRRKLTQPLTYTSLRKKAIAAELERLSKLNLDTPSWDVDELVEETYQVWENERHFAAERYLYPDAISMLETVKQSFPDACIAAVTNGKGNPLCMGTLKQYFEFCVSGEDDDIFPRRKPDSGIYEVTKEKYRARYQHHNAESHLWCHVGDCLINDVGASAACGAFAVWYAPMLENVAGGKTQPNYSTLSHSEWQQRERQANADREKVAARITSLPELMGAISEFVAGSK